MRIPVCNLCGKPVGDNEYDSESGGYFSRHMKCYSTASNGRFMVLSDNSPERSNLRYHLLNAAREQCQHLADWNYSEYPFWVVDTQTGETVFRTSGKLSRPTHPVSGSPVQMDPSCRNLFRLR